MSRVELLEGDALTVLRGMGSGSVDCVVTSPPYYSLRDYGIEGQVGAEGTPEEYVKRLVGIFREVKRVLVDSGTLWLNLGDSYCGGGHGPTGKTSAMKANDRDVYETRQGFVNRKTTAGDGVKPKDLLGIPWLVAFALRADGWYLRMDCVWHKPNAMPESVRDRPTKAHEYVFLFAKSESYYYDYEAVREEASEVSLKRVRQRTFAEQTGGPKDYGVTGVNGNRSMRKALENFAKNPGRNRRSVWSIPTRGYRGAHFATYPEALVEPCIKAGCPKGGVILDPFSGAATTGLVAARLGRDYIGIELNPEYNRLARARLAEAGYLEPVLIRG